MDVRQGAGAGAGGAPPEAHHRRVPVAKRPTGRVLVDYNQNAWGRTLASIYSVRPQPRAPRVDAGDLEGDRARACAIEDFRIDNVPARVAKLGDLWKPLNAG